MIQIQFNHNLETLLGNTKLGKIALAVSGGADSIAMLKLASIWARDSGVQLTVFSVDHNLRPEAKSELLYVKTITKQLGHKFYALSWCCGANKIALQKKARAGRYDLMTNKCHELGIDTLLTAHHADDMLETYLMRKQKKSGVFGLSTPHSFFHNNIRILRPLFSLPKQELISYLSDQKTSWMEDESNNLDLYERNRLRKKIALLTDTEKADFISEMHSVSKRAQELTEKLIATIAQIVQINNYGFALIDLEQLRIVDKEIKIQILNYVLTVISGKTTLPRFRSTDKLLESLNLRQKIECSLHGCILIETVGNLLIFREKTAIKSISVKLGIAQYWDSRFAISFQHPNLNYHIDYLSFADYLTIKDNLNLDDLAKRSNNNHKAILFTLPAIKNLEKIVAIPHISYYDNLVLQTAVRVVFRPSFISRFTHFL